MASPLLMLYYALDCSRVSLIDAISFPSLKPIFSTYSFGKVHVMFPPCPLFTLQGFCPLRQLLFLHFAFD